MRVFVHLLPVLECLLNLKEHKVCYYWHVLACEPVSML